MSGIFGKPHLSAQQEMSLGVLVMKCCNCTTIAQLQGYNEGTPLYI